MHEWSLQYLTLTDEELKERLDFPCECTNCLMHKVVARTETARRSLIWNKPLPDNEFSAADIVGEEDQSR